MSDYLKVAVITSATTMDGALTVLSNNLDLLFEDHQLGFRGYGSVMRLAFDGQECRGEQLIKDSIPSVADLDRARLDELVARHGWITIDASFGIIGVERLLNIALFLYPTFDPHRPVCAVAWLDAWFYRTLYGDDDQLDDEAAERLRKLILALGAHDAIEGFHAACIDAFAETITFDTAKLRDSLLAPRSIAQLRKGKDLIHGLVTGISRSVLSPREIETIHTKWADAEWLETINGFLVMNNLIPIPDEYLLDDD